MIYKLLTLLCVSSLLFSCTDVESPIEDEKPKENTEHKFVKVRNLFWMEENLNVSSFRNGEEIPEAKSETEWRHFMEKEEPAFCYYEFNPEYGDKYGKLYNFYVLKDERGLAPEGTRLPTNSDWMDIGGYMGTSEIATMGIGFIDIWLKNNNLNGDNKFLSIPAGFHTRSGEFLNLDISAHWWQGESNTHAYGTHNSFNTDVGYVSREASKYFKDGLSVRCIKD